jgi:hypothetical protein
LHHPDVELRQLRKQEERSFMTKSYTGKTEVIRNRGPWRNIDEVEFATWHIIAN